MITGIVRVNWTAPRLWTGWVGNDGIRLDASRVVNTRRIKTRLVVHQSAHARVQCALTGVHSASLRDASQ